MASERFIVVSEQEINQLNEIIEAKPNFTRLSLLCILTGKQIPSVKNKVTDTSCLVFIELADAIFCGEDSNEIEAIESMASRLLDNVASTVLSGSNQWGAPCDVNNKPPPYVPSTAQIIAGKN